MIFLLFLLTSWEKNWQPKQVTIGLFEAIETIGQNLTTNLTKLLDQYGLRKKIIAYVKDERSNLTIMTITLKWIVKCEILGLDESAQGIYFGHSFFKACLYATMDEKVFKNHQFIFIKYCVVKFAKMYDLALKVEERQTRMELGMFKFQHSP